MNVRRSGLGRGLGALIPTGPADDDLSPIGARFEEIPVGMIDPNPKQPRDVFDEEALAELVTSIKEVGVLQPVVVREIDGGRYQLIMGERRLRASKAAGVERVPAIVRETSDDNLLRDALLENLHRQQLNPLEEAAAYQQLLEEFGATHEELADRFGRSRSHVSNTLRLMNLSAPVQRRVAAGVISAGHARALLALDDSAEQDALAARIVAEGLSVRAVEEIVTAPSVNSPVLRAPRGPKASAPGMNTLAAQLADLFETRVRIDIGKRRGKLIIEFATVDDLERIVASIAPGLRSTEATDTAAVESVPDSEDRYEPEVSDGEADQGNEFGQVEDTVEQPSEGQAPGDQGDEHVDPDQQY